jgi:hypothetical protein
MNRSRLRPRLAALLTALFVSVGLLSLSTVPAWAAAGTITEFPATGASYGITAGPDGNLWFTESSTGNVGRITPNGVVTEFTAHSGEGITAGPDGNLWFTDPAGKIGRITTSGVVTEFSIHTQNSFPLGITTGPDGNLTCGSPKTLGARSGVLPPVAKSPNFLGPCSGLAASLSVRMATCGSRR